MATPVYLEIATKRTFACSVEWPGWCRSGRDEEAALATLADYADRYGAALALAGLRLPRGATRFEVVERRAGGGGTDFGALEKPCALDGRPLRAADARRLADIVEAAYFRMVGLARSDRADFATALRAARAPVPERERGKPWPWRYAARRVAWHALDHAWEIEDKDPTRDRGGQNR